MRVYDFNSVIERETFIYFNEVVKNPDITFKVIQYSKQYDVPIILTFSLLEPESHFNRFAYNINDDGTIDRGLGQLNSYYFPMPIKDYWDIDINLKTSIRFLHFCLENNNNDWALGCIAYNSGMPAIQKNRVKELTFRYLTTILLLKNKHERTLEERIKNIL